MSQQYGGQLTRHRFKWAFFKAPQSRLAMDDALEVLSALKVIQELDTRLNAVREEIAKLPIMKELPRDRQRATRVHQRGNFLDPGAEVQPAILASFMANRFQSPENKSPANKSPDRLRTNADVAK